MVHFDRFTFDPATLELRSEGRPVPLQQQPARVLALLLERPGRLVTRDELRKAIWGDDTFVDFGRSLNFCVSQIRAALEDDAEAPKFIETLRGRGYRFVGRIGPVTQAEPAGPVSPVQRGAQVQQAGLVRPAGRRWILTAVAAALVLAPVVWGIAVLGREEAPAVTVEPFAASAGTEEWSASLQAQIVAHLAHTPSRVVADRAAIDRAAWRLGARVDRSDEQYRVTVTLRDPSGAVRFTDIFDGPPGDWIEAQNEMARIISQAVRYTVEGPGAVGGIERRAPRRKVPFS